jgi:hypothetical protein
MRRETASFSDPDSGFIAKRFAAGAVYASQKFNAGCRYDRVKRLVSAKAKATHKQCVGAVVIDFRLGPEQTFRKRVIMTDGLRMAAFGGKIRARVEAGKTLVAAVKWPIVPGEGTARFSPEPAIGLVMAYDQS